LATSAVIHAVKRFRGFIKAPIRADNDRPAWKDSAIFHYQPRGDDHGADYPAGACISSSQAGRDAHGLPAQLQWPGGLENWRDGKGRESQA
jgi:hypothetical protein